MTQSSVMVSLPQMVDLALNCPEVGAVNFNILHSLLHVLIQQVDLLECKVEFKGNDSDRLQTLIAASKPGPSLNLTEYVVTPGKDQRKVVSKKTRYKQAAKRGSKDEVVVERELRVIDQRKDSKEDPLPQPAQMGTMEKSTSSGSLQTVVVVEPTDAASTATPHVSVALSRVHFDTMEEDLEKLKEEIRELKELPGNLGLIDAIRNPSSDSTPVLDMFQILTLSKRVEATETGIGKLASMMEDLAREQNAGPIIAQKASDLQVDIKASGKGSSRTLVQSAKVTEELKEKVEKLTKRVDAIEGGQVPSTTTDTTTTAEGGAVPEGRLTDLENKFAEYSENMSTLDTMFNNQVNTLQSHLTDLEKEIGEIVERINAGFPGVDTGGSDQGVREMYNKMVAMQSELDTVTETAAKLMEDKEERQVHMDALLEQIELLKTIKANREDLEDALADKADTCAVNRKVSHDQFDAACDDLSRGIEDALTKLTQQEQLWQQALDDIQHEIENKLDKMELTPLRDFVHNKLKMLQDRLKALAALKKDTEAAGTKSKFLRNVNCISCDKEVIMRKQMDPTLMPPPPALPPTKSMGPYLAYELDNLRKQQKCAPHSRNMNHFENAMGGAKSGMGDDHMCNRYCGGSHTVTTPQQRVARLGHFLQQWGPETYPVNEGEIRGTDGQMYKSRESGDMIMGARAPSIEESYVPSMKGRPSMMVHGDILSARGGGRNASSPGSEVTEQRTSKTGEQLKDASMQLRQSLASQRKGSGQRASLTGQRASVDAAGKRASKISAGRASFTKDEAPPVSEEPVSAPAPSPVDENPAPSPTEEAAPVEEAPPAAEAEGDDVAERPPEAEGGEGEAPPVEDAPTAE